MIIEKMGIWSNRHVVNYISENLVTAVVASYYIGDKHQQLNTGTSVMAGKIDLTPLPHFDPRSEQVLWARDGRPGQSAFRPTWQPWVLPKENSSLPSRLWIYTLQRSPHSRCAVGQSELFESKATGVEKSLSPKASGKVNGVCYRKQNVLWLSDRQCIRMHVAGVHLLPHKSVSHQRMDLLKVWQAKSLFKDESHQTENKATIAQLEVIKCQSCFRNTSRAFK